MKLLTLSWWLWLAIILSNCGQQSIEVKGHVDVDHNVRLQELKVYFLEECNNVSPVDECYRTVLEDCVNCKIAKVLGGI